MMGCENSKSTMAYNPLPSPFSGAFTKEDVAVIFKTWKFLHNDMVGNGGKVFVHIFKMAPPIKTLFGFEGLNGDSLYFHPRFRLHAGRFMQAVGAAVENAHSPNLDRDVGPILQTLGGRHNDFPRFDIDYIDIFRRALLEVWEETLGESFTTEAQLAWTKVFVYVTDQFKKGYLDTTNNA